MKPREPRKAVLIDARLRADCGWDDARILNISKRGLMVRAPKAPPRGTYVEICRGTHRIVARVVWVSNDRFGARTQDPLPVDAIAGGGNSTPAPANRNDRRTAPRRPSHAQQHDRSRRWSRRAEFAGVVAMGCAAALLAFDTVRDTLSRPLTQIEARLADPG